MPFEFTEKQREHLRLLSDERNSMMYWYPRIKDCVPTPKTIMLPLPKGWFKWLDKDIPAQFQKSVKSAARKLGYPAFIRTDVMAAKHEWVDTCYVPSERALMRNLRQLLDVNLSVDMVGEMVPHAIAVREFLKLRVAFKAFRGTPIAREYRCFIRGHNVECLHPYWFADPIQFWGIPEPKDWRQKLHVISVCTSTELDMIKHLADQAGQAVSGDYWSVDICQTETGKWYVTDMALGEISYHYPTCPRAGKQD